MQGKTIAVELLNSSIQIVHFSCLSTLRGNLLITSSATGKSVFMSCAKRPTDNGSELNICDLSYTPLTEYLKH